MSGKRIGVTLAAAVLAGVVVATPAASAEAAPPCGISDGGHAWIVNNCAPQNGRKVFLHSKIAPGEQCVPARTTRSFYKFPTYIEKVTFTGAYC